MKGTGTPAAMAECEDELTPMMSQYFELCAEYDSAMVLFQVGDFYETFCEAAERCARLLEITLTSREDSTGEYPMAGIPIDNATSYVETLLDAGYRVAIADQIEDPSEASGVVERAVTRVITPGTVLDDALLGADNNYLACVGADEEESLAVAFLDLSTGSFRVASGTERVIQDELDRQQPTELLIDPPLEGTISTDCTETIDDSISFESDAAKQRVGAYVPSPEAVFETTAELIACGALLAYAEYTQGVSPGGLASVTRISRYAPTETMGLSGTTIESLELFENQHGDDDHTLLAVLDETTTAMGRRTLADWLRRPLCDASAIQCRLDAVETLVATPLVRETLRELLADAYDLERLIARVADDRANARDCRSLQATLEILPAVAGALDTIDCQPLADRRDALPALDGVCERIDAAIQHDPPIELTDGGIITDGYDEQLDSLRSTQREGEQWINELEATERDRTGIDSLKVGYNEVHGYYIEVTNPNLDAVPEEYTRRQTLKNAERFYTPALKDREDAILGASERATELEYQLFCELRADVGDHTDRIQQAATVLAELDVLTTLATVATRRDYVRPAFDGTGSNGAIEIEGGRHPVVETTQPLFVPNDTTLCDERIAIITGPNMSGKSTYMRQIALIQIMAQLGSFVPADRARLPIVDRVFTRVGASDDIAGGQSTFMREMSELSTILHSATPSSLVILDEVGRGTATTDGRAIARATTEFLHDEIGALTLFATHYHELTELADELAAVTNVHFTVDRDGEELTFLHTVLDGAASGSYGVAVARLAGVPDPVIDRVESLHDEDTDANQTATSTTETDDSIDSTTTIDDSSSDTIETHVGDRSLRETIAELSIADTTPLEALQTLYELQRRIDTTNGPPTGRENGRSHRSG
ncbi:DNA mismatch repair protein MutS [Halocatena halophila]|uniref:DNA mismatch repair protein MutS n=1 Tax=Halocatena halophila TaxID=2814576 RepID=UPI002ED06EB9